MDRGRLCVFSESAAGAAYALILVIIAVQTKSVPRADGYQPVRCGGASPQHRGSLMSDRAILGPILDTYRYLLQTETDPDRRQTILVLIREIGKSPRDSAKPASLRSWGGEQEPWLFT